MHYKKVLSSYTEIVVLLRWQREKEREIRNIFPFSEKMGKRLDMKLI